MFNLEFNVNNEMYNKGYEKKRMVDDKQSNPRVTIKMYQRKIVNDTNQSSKKRIVHFKHNK